MIWPTSDNCFHRTSLFPHFWRLQPYNGLNSPFTLKIPHTTPPTNKAKKEKKAGNICTCIKSKLGNHVSIQPPSLDGQPGRVLLVPNLCNTLLFGTFKATEIVLQWDNPASEVYREPLWCWACSLMSPLSAVGSHRQVWAVQSCPITWI